VTFLFVLRLEPDDNNEGQLESFATEPLNLKHHAAYIRLALQMEDGGEIASRAVSDGKHGTSNKRQVIRVLGAYQSPPNNLTRI